MPAVIILEINLRVHIQSDGNIYDNLKKTNNHALKSAI